MRLSKKKENCVCMWIEDECIRERKTVQRIREANQLMSSPSREKPVYISHGLRTTSVLRSCSLSSKQPPDSRSRGD